jgi:hypothetical protein
MPTCSMWQMHVLYKFCRPTFNLGQCRLVVLCTTSCSHIIATMDGV